MIMSFWAFLLGIPKNKLRVALDNLNEVNFNRFILEYKQPEQLLLPSKKKTGNFLMRLMPYSKENTSPFDDVETDKLLHITDEGNIYRRALVLKKSLPPDALLALIHKAKINGLNEVEAAKACKSIMALVQ